MHTRWLLWCALALKSQMALHSLLPPLIIATAALIIVTGYGRSLGFVANLLIFLRRVATAVASAAEGRSIGEFRVKAGVDARRGHVACHGSRGETKPLVDT